VRKNVMRLITFDYKKSFTNQRDKKPDNPVLAKGIPIYNTGK